MDVVLCEIAGKKEFTAGNKARTDTVQILKECGYKHIPLFVCKSRKAIILLQILFGCFKGMIKANKGDNIFIQYPYYPATVNRTIVKLLIFGRFFKQYKIVLLIHDVVGLRDEIISYNTLRKEIRLFNTVDEVISHNKTMQSTLLTNGARNNYSLLGPFDYLYDKEPIHVDFQGKLKVVIAGNLSREKCGYIYKLSEIKGCLFNLYGIGYAGKDSDTISYKGQFHPDKLIENLEGNFGLVWDGDSIETCNGMYGEYLKYNNPHKFSLYLAAGLPLIVWKKSALASYVNKYGLGICVNSLHELSSLNISKDEYMKMRENVLKYRKEIASGGHLKTVLNQNISHFNMT